jgi:cation:H+ antiporter
VGAGLPALVLRLSGHHLNPEVTALICGVAILGSAFLLSWALEVAQLHISAALAIAILALIAILPEYAIEAVLAWDAGAAWTIGADPEHVPEVARAAANVTGANRLLIGVGWSMVALFFWIRNRRDLVLSRGMSLEFTILTVATALTFLLFFLREISLILSGVLIAVYLFYLWASSRLPSEEPELMGPSAAIGALPRVPQIALTVLLVVYAAVVIFAAAEPFVEGLVETGKKFGIPEFTLIQWLAPLASESPELVIALLLTMRANPLAGMTALVSSEVNQLTLLIGSMPVLFSWSFGEAHSFPLDHQQAVEFLLTASMSLFAIVLLARMRVPLYGALLLLGLFVAHLFFTDPQARLWFSILFLALSVLILVLDRGRIVDMYRRAVRVFSFRQAEGPEPAASAPPFSRTE